MEHTQGKWFNNGGRIYAQQGDDIREICDVGLVNHQSAEDTANARLIKAAPELLECCIEMLAALKSRISDVIGKEYRLERIKELQNAINKAQKS
jgi:hypothetical protein